MKSVKILELKFHAFVQDQLKQVFKGRLELKKVKQLRNI